MIQYYLFGLYLNQQKNTSFQLSNTCKACKAFFRGYLDKCNDLPCINQRNSCMASANFVFVCKLCRFNKCLETGMSRSKLKMGRYTKERHFQNEREIKNMVAESKVIPYLSPLTNAYNMVSKCLDSFENLKIKDVS